MSKGDSAMCKLVIHDEVQFRFFDKQTTNEQNRQTNKQMD